MKINNDLLMLMVLTSGLILGYLIGKKDAK
jgi:hypothetical protein